MRTGLSTIQQTLTAEAAAVLNASIEEAGRRGHGQTTPLHVAAMLLASPAGLVLRQACVRSHPASSHPLQCRALELCFSVALDRLPSSAGAGAEPPISNALMAALKRAQAHQRRGCPEQQQQPLLAVKVELDQLVVSILDDPGVSRVMREASFSSPAVKAAIEHSLPSSSTAAPANPPTPARNIYINPRLQPQPGSIGGASATADSAAPRRTEEVKKVMDILTRAKKRNPILVGDSNPDAIMRDVLRCIEAADAPPVLRATFVISAEKELASADRAQFPTKIKQLGDVIETRFGTTDSSGGGVILDLGDLKWLVESPGGSAPAQQQQIISEMGRAAVGEMAALLGKFGGTSRVWLVGTATCATYLRCQVYHPTMESDWDLQAVPIAPRSPLPGLFPRLGGNGILSSSVESLSPSKGLQTLATGAIPLRRSTEIDDPARRTALCPVCMENYERELAKLVAREFEKSSSDSRPESRQALPQWLRTAPPSSAAPTTNQSKGQELKWKQSTEELLKRWRETCARLHTSLNPAAITAPRPPIPALSLPSSHNSLVLPHQALQPGISLSQPALPLKASNHLSLVSNSLTRPASPPRSPVRTDLVLGNSKISDIHKERVKGFTKGCIQDERGDKFTGTVDSGSFKRLLTGLAETVTWQPEAASAIANIVMQCKSGNGKRRGSASRGDMWLLFIGPDRVGKRRMAAALSELVCGTGPITVNLSRSRTDDEGAESNFSFRGKTAVDRVSEAIRQNPFSVIMIEDFDRGDVLVRSMFKRAIERGRLPDSYGREFSLGSVIFVLTADWLPADLKSSQESLIQSEEKILKAANSPWQLALSVGEKSTKRRAEWLYEVERHRRPRKESSSAPLSLDLNLNLAAGGDDDAGESSRNSSDLTAEHEQVCGRLGVEQSVSSLSPDLIDSMDDAIVFKPVDFGPLRRRVLDSIDTKFSSIMGNVRPLHVDDDVLDRMVGGLWISGDANRLDECVERVLVPGICQLKSNLKADDGAVVRLSLLREGEHTLGSNGVDCLPRKVSVAIDGIGL